MPDRAARLLAAAPATLAWLFVAAFVLAPLAWMLWSTFAAESGLTLDAWRQVLADDTDWGQLLDSVVLATAASAVAAILGFGHAWLTHRTDLPGGRALGPLGILPLVVPPILVAMSFSDFADVTGFWSCAALLGVSYAPFVAVLTARGLRSVDGRLYEAALVARGRRPADRLLARLIAPEVAAGCLLAFVFALSEHGVPEFLTVKGKAWHTYSEGIFSLWTRRMIGTSHTDMASPIIAAVPLLLVISVSLAVALSLRARATVVGDFRPLPVRRLGAARVPALLLPAAYLGCGVVLPVITMGLWAAGSTQSIEPMSWQRLATSFGVALNEAGSDLGYTAAIGGMTVVLLMAVAVPLARQSARRTRIVDWLAVLPVAVPAILLAIGLVGVFNRPATGNFYDSSAMVACAYSARFLPFAVLTLSHMVRRISRETEEAARLTGRSAPARALWIHLPPLIPAIWSAACLVFILALRELDVAVVMPAGNGTIVRRLSNIVHFGGEDMGGALAILLLIMAALLPALTVLLTGRRLRPLS